MCGMEFLPAQILGVSDDSVTGLFNPVIIRPLLLNAFRRYSLMLLGVNSIFTIPVSLGTDRECNILPKTTNER